jgi:hypothetical protein
MNLAANHSATDVTAAEFIRTFRTHPFLGNMLLRRLRREEKASTERETSCHRVRVPLVGVRGKDAVKVNFDDAYGYRGRDPRVYHLSPWEFTSLWSLELLRAPNWYGHQNRRTLTRWTPAGVAYRKELAADDNNVLPGYKAGEHYKVVDAVNSDDYISFPDVAATTLLRHSYLMRRNRPPTVPQPSMTPLPRKCMSANDKARILSIYVRPWTLLQARHPLLFSKSEACLWGQSDR